MADQSTVSSRWYHGLLDFVYPPLCLGCGSYVDDGGIICDDCMRRIDTFEAPWCLNCRQAVPAGNRCESCHRDSFLLYAYANYVPPLREVIIQFKFKGITSPAAWFAAAIFGQFGEAISGFKPDALLPVPLYGSREYHRGYNQARLIADHLGRLLDIPVDANALSRIKKRRPQARLSETARARNIRGVFAAEPAPEGGATVILVDDVVTSGSTAREARAELITAGYSVPAVIAVGHGV